MACNARAGRHSRRKRDLHHTEQRAHRALVYKRNKLQPDSLKLKLIVPTSGLWRVDLERHDQPFLAQWRPGDDLRIESKQLRYRKHVEWPSLAGIMYFP